MPSLPSTSLPSGQTPSKGLTTYFTSKIEQAEHLIHSRTQNLRRLEAQRNALNARVRLLREELQLLQEPGSYVGEVVKVMGKKKVLVKVQPEGKYGTLPFPHRTRIQFESLTFALPLSLASLIATRSQWISCRLCPFDPALSTHSKPSSRPPFRLVPTPLDPANETRPSRPDDDGRESSRLDLRDGRRTRTTDQRDQRSHRTPRQTPRTLRCTRYRST